MAVDKTFVVEKICPVCEQKMRVVKTRSRIMVTSRDDDACTHYKDFNPYYYTVWICEKKTFTTKMPDRHLTILRAVLLTKNIKVPFASERSIENASTAFRLALKYQDLIRGKASKKAKYAHQLAWVYREAGDVAQEHEFLAKAAKYYEEALATEHFPVDALTDNAVIYLIAAIYRRLGEPDKATPYLSKLIGDQGVRQRDPRVFDKARDLWSDIRAERKK